MADLESTQDAHEVVTQFWDDHQWRCRRIGSVGIGLAEDSTEEVRSYAVKIGMERGPLPPKFDYTLQQILAEHDLAYVPVDYAVVGIARAYSDYKKRKHPSAGVRFA